MNWEEVNDELNSLIIDPVEEIDNWVAYVENYEEEERCKSDWLILQTIP